MEGEGWVGEGRGSSHLVVIRLDLLKAQNVGFVVEQLAEQVTSSVLPMKQPGGTVGGEIPLCINVGEEVVGEQGEPSCC